MKEMFSRTESLLGAPAMERLKKARVALFGLGGVGSAALEALVRSGVGRVEVFDHDTLSVTNLNRQLLATADMLGAPKTQAAVKRALAINPKVEIIPHKTFYLPESSGDIDLSRFDFIIDAIDTVTAKLELAVRATEAGVPIISCMGTGNKMDITRLRVSDIGKTTDCPLARVMRKELKRRGIERLQVVWSDEKPYMEMPTGELKGNRPAPASAIFVPAAAGLILAEEAVKQIIGK